MDKKVRRLEEFCGVKPYVQFIPEYDMQSTTEWYGIKALWYEGAQYQGRKTKVFALIGYPDIAESEKIPAVVLVHGGGGHPYAEWIRQWNRRGYAAIAMDTTGYFPCENAKGIIGTEGQKGEGNSYIHELYGNLSEDGYTAGPDNSAMEDCELPIEEQWMYHAVADTILAHNILQSDPRIDSRKIGISGISWGGVITSIAIGYDTRYAFAIPIYGSAYLDYLPAPFIPRVFGEHAVKKLWSASDRLPNVHFPVLWLCYLEDTCFCFGANSFSYLATKKSASSLSIKRGMGHSHIRAWQSPEGWRFAQRVIAGKTPLIRPLAEPEGFGEICFEIGIPEDFTEVSAEIYYLTEPAKYDEKNKLLNEWKCTKAEIYNSKVFGIVPKEACGYFVELKGFADAECYVSTTSWVESFDH